jgi:two-component system response regulator FlrC
MSNIILETQNFENSDLFLEILKNRVIDYSIVKNSVSSQGTIAFGDKFLCTERYENIIGGQQKLLEVARKFKAKEVFVFEEGSKSFSIKSELGGKYLKLSLPKFSDTKSPSKNYGLQLLASFLSIKGSMIAGDKKSYNLLKIAERVSKADVTVFINGPTGTGKEVLSQFIHEQSKRKSEPFVAINCAAIPENMLEAILFGHEKGSFTGASTANKGIFRAADKGTLLLDEISEMPLSLQAKLLRVLQEKIVTPIGSQQNIAVDVRVIATTNRNMEVEIAENRFREDLFYRLNVFPLTSMNLSQRPDDIVPILASLILKHTSLVEELPWIQDDAIEELLKHPWPGNVRELENVVQRALVLCSNQVISKEDIITDVKLNQFSTKEMMEATLLKQTAVA